MAEAAPDYLDTARKVEAALVHGLGDGTLVDTERVAPNRVWVVVISKDLNSRSEEEKQQRVWDVLKASLKDEAQLVAMVVAYGTQELM
jgi:hypothetical protein